MKKLIIIIVFLLATATVFGRFRYPVTPPPKPPNLDNKCRSSSSCVFVNCPDWYVNMKRSHGECAKKTETNKRDILKRLNKHNSVTRKGKSKTKPKKRIEWDF